MAKEMESVKLLYEETKSIKKTARKSGYSEKTCMKMLITMGIYPTKRAQQITRLRMMGMTMQEMMDYLHCSAPAIKSYYPYTKGTYKAASKTANAKFIAKCRENKKKGAADNGAESQR